MRIELIADSNMTLFPKYRGRIVNDNFPWNESMKSSDNIEIDKTPL